MCHSEMRRISLVYAFNNYRLYSMYRDLYCCSLIIAALDWNAVSAVVLCEGPLSDIPENIDYDFAQQELMLQQMEDDPIQVAIRSIEKQHEEDKQGKMFVMMFGDVVLL